jgi:hypothetical protein
MRKFRFKHVEINEHAELHHNTLKYLFENVYENRNSVLFNLRNEYYENFPALLYNQVADKYVVYDTHNSYEKQVEFKKLKTILGIVSSCEVGVDLTNVIGHKTQELGAQTLKVMNALGLRDHRKVNLTPTVKSVVQQLRTIFNNFGLTTITTKRSNVYVKDNEGNFVLGKNGKKKRRRTRHFFIAPDPLLTDNTPQEVLDQLVQHRLEFMEGESQFAN